MRTIKSIVLCILFLCAFWLVACKPEEVPVPVVPDPDPVEDTTRHIPLAREDQIAFLSLYSTPEQLVNEGDDDEATAWLWMHQQFPQALFLPFNQIKEHTLDSLRVLFWIRDVETDNIDDVTTIPADALNAVQFIEPWYKNGGNIILWSHAVLYIENLGRLPQGTYTAPSHDWECFCGKGGLDLGHWLMAVQLFPGGKFKKDHSTHPLFKDITIFTDNNVRGFMVKGPGWSENHNCLFFNYPHEITGRSWQAEICYTLLKDYYGITPLGVWDSQINWVSQLNVYELQKGNTDYKGRALCVGNGGCEFSMKDYRQVGVDANGAPIYETTDDKSPFPHNNCYQENILLMARNAIEYMRLGNE
ncbi:MAG: DUF4960 domain-containing protein [Paludibacteraceae bacterium]|nr:DUF4960 domain-containing protein [Paludibacteraceae bacterium]